MPTTMTDGTVSLAELERRRHIWKAVIECVAEDGIAGATMRKVAERAGVSTGMLTYYYRNKKELMSATLAAATNHFFESVNNAAGVDFGPRRLEAVFALGLSDATDPEQPPHSFWLEYWAEASRDPDLKALYFEQFKRTREYLARSVEAGMETGEYRDNLDPHLVADTLSALIQGLRGKIELSGEIVPPERALEICRLVLSLLRPSDGASARLKG